jgi:hypothetical protein
MTITETLSVFAGIPLGVILLVALLVYAPSRSRRAPRYRPGLPFSFSSVWYLAPHDSINPRHHSDRRALTSGSAASTQKPKQNVGGARASW